MSQAPRQLPPKGASDFDPRMYEFWRAVYQIWSNTDQGNFIISQKTPASASADGTPGEFCWDSSYLYLCIAKNTWRRIAHATW